MPVVQIGDVPWARGELVANIKTFAEIYRQRPIPVNVGGMRSPHSFLTWFALKRLQPKAIIESGVWKGQGTWLIEQACPNAEVYCLDLDLSVLEYKSPRATYYERDFSTIDWSRLPREDTLVFFDDHQNAYERLKTAKWLGFRHAVFEDNYPPRRGDCYSLKQAFSCSGFGTTPGKAPVKRRLRQGLQLLRDSILDRDIKQGREGTPQVAGASFISPNDVDAIYLRGNLEIYHELPPVFQVARTRWGDPWEESFCSTPEPLLTSVEEPYQQVFLDEAAYYTWICYVRLKR